MKYWTGFACAFAVLAIAGTAHAQNYPAHDIKMIVPFPAGGPSDTVARIVAEGMSRHLGQQVVVENVGGAGGTLGATRASEAAPDGYTIMAASMGTVIAAPSFYPNLKYDSTKDFEPIGMTANAPAAIAIKASIPAKNVKEFVEWAKKEADAGRLSWHRPGRERSHRRTRRLPLRADRQHGWSHADRQNPRYRAVVERTPCIDS
jgi:tripartite-type tricarboxylate transporter receptor subunit TctC